MEEADPRRMSRRSAMGKALLGGTAVILGAGAAQGGSGHGKGHGMNRVFQAGDFGAVGDGKSDDTAALQAALDAAAGAGGGCVRLPSGRYRVTRTLTVKSSEGLDLVGDGRSTVLLHETPDPLLVWPEGVACDVSTVRDLRIHAVGTRDPSVAAILCSNGAARSEFRNLMFTGDTGSGIVTERVCDTTTFEHCLIWGGLSGTGIKVACGSEVRIFGGRIIGKHKGVSGVGVHLTGDNGGVHIVTTDLIGLETAVKIGEPGAKSNREVFITHATLDGCVHGLVQTDHAYTSIAGCWAASSDEEQILLAETAERAILAISGGTIFNGGAWNRGGGKNGIVVRAGSFLLNGVTVRHNKGTGILVEGPRVRDYTISGCRIADNGVGLVIGGENYAVTGNVFARNGTHLVQHAEGKGTVTGNAMAG